MPYNKYAAGRKRITGPKCASGKNSAQCWRCAFVLSPQAVDLPEKSACAYDGSMTGQTIYAYVGGNPLSGIDPYGLRDVDVYIWRAEGLSVGHVMVTEAGSTQVILSQFPSNGLAIGPNEVKSFADTMTAENRSPSEVWRIHVPDDAKFDSAAAKERGLKLWTANPSDSSTQCSIAASRALKAGGVGLNTITTGTLMPGFFANGLQATPGIGVRLQ